MVRIQRDGPSRSLSLRVVILAGLRHHVCHLFWRFYASPTFSRRALRGRRRVIHNARLREVVPLLRHRAKPIRSKPDESHTFWRSLRVRRATAQFGAICCSAD